jgi:hypothetical protein
MVIWNRRYNKEAYHQDTHIVMEFLELAYITYDRITKMFVAYLHFAFFIARLSSLKVWANVT